MRDRDRGRPPGDRQARSLDQHARCRIDGQPGHPAGGDARGVDEAIGRIDRHRDRSGLGQRLGRDVRQPAVHLTDAVGKERVIARARHVQEASRPLDGDGRRVLHAERLDLGERPATGIHAEGRDDVLLVVEHIQEAPPWLQRQRDGIGCARGGGADSRESATAGVQAIGEDTGLKQDRGSTGTVRMGGRPGPRRASRRRFGRRT